MLTDIIYERYLGNEAVLRYEFKIIDSEFGTVLTTSGGQKSVHKYGVAAGYCSAVITTYSERQLNVPINLIKLLLINKQGYGWGIADQIDWWQVYQPLFVPELKAELDKYLALL